MQMIVRKTNKYGCNKGLDKRQCLIDQIVIQNSRKPFLTVKKLKSLGNMSRKDLLTLLTNQW